MITYHVEMDNGIRLSLLAESAAHALTRALYRCRGVCVVKLYSNGCDKPDPEYGNFNADLGGIIHYDVPPHRPVTEDMEIPADL